LQYEDPSDPPKPPPPVPQRGVRHRHVNISIYSAPDRAAQYCDERVCLSLSLSPCFFSVRDHIFGPTRPIFTKFFLRVPRSSSGGVVIRYALPVFIDDVIFAHKPRLLDVDDQLKCRAHAALVLATKYAQ